jgi:tRNA modification GTPase
VASHFLRPGGAPIAETALERVLYGRWGVADGEEVVVVRRARDRVEVQCHGGVAATDAILRGLSLLGVAPLAAPPDDAWRGPTPLPREAWRLLAEAPTERVAAIVLDQALGAFERALAAALDAIESRDTTAAIALLEPIAARSAAVLRPSGGSTIVAPWRVAIVGPPNAGKSTLLNALVGYERAIVADTHGTTRDALAAVTAIDGWPVTFYDTAGQRATNDAVEAAGVEVARATARSADAVLVVQDLSTHAGHEARAFRDGVLAEVAAPGRAVLVASKGDLAMPAEAAAATAVGAVVLALPPGGGGTGVAPVVERVARALDGMKHQPGAPAAIAPRHAEVVDEALDGLRGGRPDRAAASLRALLAGVS